MAMTQAINAQLNLATDKFELNINSPDEEAFQECMNMVNYTFATRNTDRITLDIMGNKKMFKLIETLPFDPYRKMMSIVVKNSDGGYVLYSKGADSSLLPKTVFRDKKEKDKIVKAIDGYASKGYRTMVFCRRVLSRNEY